jgi:ribose transport system substrate-binding protein
MHDLAEQYGLDLRVYDAALDPYRQITLLERARTDGARALVICPLDISLLHDSLTAAEEAAVPLVFLAADIPSYGGVLLSGDDYQMGYRAGQAGGRLIASLFDGAGRILVLDFPDMPILVQRATGMVDGALSIAPDSVVVGHGLGGTRDNGYQSVKAALEAGEEFNVILSINDAGSFGAVEALEEAGISTADVSIASVDAEALALTYIRRDYYLRASVAVGRQEFSEAAVNSTVRLLAGSAMPETLVVPPGEVITRNNVRPLGGVEVDA